MRFGRCHWNPALGIHLDLGQRIGQGMRVATDFRYGNTVGLRKALFVKHTL